MRVSKQEREEALERLRKWIKPGDTLYTVLRHVSPSGMSRRIDVYLIEDNEPRFLSGNISKVLGYRLHDKGGLVVNGCGMDMGFEVVYNLGRTLFPEGFKLPDGVRGRNGDTSGYDNDGGYALKHRWL